MHLPISDLDLARLDASGWAGRAATSRESKDQSRFRETAENRHPTELKQEKLWNREGLKWTCLAENDFAETLYLLWTVLFVNEPIKRGRGIMLWRFLYQTPQIQFYRHKKPTQIEENHLLHPTYVEPFLSEKIQKTHMHTHSEH